MRRGATSTFFHGVLFSTVKLNSPGLIVVQVDAPKY